MYSTKSEELENVLCIRLDELPMLQGVAAFRVSSYS